MNIGLVYPQTDFGSDPTAIRDYTQMAEGLGFTHILAYDHVIGANPNRPGGWKGPYTHETTFHEPFGLFSFMAALTKSIQFVTGVIILPQRQTVLVAKQAATLDVLSNGRLRLGVGLGWNEVEYISLNENFHNRGKRIEEQVTLMRQLWTQPLVTFQGKWHTVPDAGIKPLPVQQPIPVWFGGTADAALKRAAQFADGWLTNYRTVADARPALDALRRHLEAAGRENDIFGLEPRILYGDGAPGEWLKSIEDWKEAGATHLSFNTMGKGFETPAAHMGAVQEFAAALGKK
jgi:probable F420-dependent oxidoreductase